MTLAELLRRHPPLGPQLLIRFMKHDIRLETDSTAAAAQLATTAQRFFRDALFCKELPDHESLFAGCARFTIIGHTVHIHLGRHP